MKTNKMNRKGETILVLVWAVTVTTLAFSCPRATAQEKTASSQDQLATLPVKLPVTRKSGIEVLDANRLAMERYELYYKAGDSIGASLWSTGEQQFAVYFPIGRSDRMYFLGLGLYWPPSKKNEGYIHSEMKNFVFCFERKGAQANLIYRIALDTRYWHPERDEEDRTPKVALSHLDIRDRLKACGYGIIGKISRYARKDLATERDYAEYTYVPYTNSLIAWLASQSKDGISWGDNASHYSVSGNPFTKAQENKFYRKHGLPVTKQELAEIQKKQPSSHAAVRKTSTSMR